MTQTKAGSLVCVGTGMTLGAHITPIARSHIENADIVYCSAATSLMEEWIMSMNTNTISLQHYYEEGKDRRHTYKAMVNTLLSSLRKGMHVVGAFYGHPGVFAKAPHDAVAQAKSESFHAHMEAGISAEACLYADMGIDPGKVGCQHYETTQFMLYERTIDPSAYLILWQIGLAGDRQAQQFTTENAYRTVLKEQLISLYSPQHNIAIYEAKSLPTDTIRIEWLALSELDKATVFQHSTLVIPPISVPVINPRAEALLADIASNSVVIKQSQTDSNF